MTKRELIARLEEYAKEERRKYEHADAWNETVEASGYKDNLDTLEAAFRWVNNSVRKRKRRIR